MKPNLADAWRLTVAGLQVLDASIESNTEMIDASTEHNVKPDPDWYVIDKHGHFHTFDDDGGLPTLDAKEIPIRCDGTCGSSPCDGSYKTVYRCKVCGKKVKPRWVDRGPNFQKMPGLTRTTITARVHMPMLSVGDLTTFRIDYGLAYGFGVARVGAIGGANDGYEVLLDVTEMGRKSTLLRGLKDGAP